MSVKRRDLVQYLMENGFYRPSCEVGGWRATMIREKFMEKLDRITIDPAICLGQPTIRGMRITVGVVLRMLAAGRSIDDVLAAYPELEQEDVRQAMRYAAWLASDQLHLIKTA